MNGVCPCSQSLALSSVELGNILAAQNNAEIAIFHDPGKGSATEGQTNKQLKIQPSQNANQDVCAILASVDPDSKVMLHLAAEFVCTAMPYPIYAMLQGTLMFNFAVKDGSLPRGQFFLSIPVTAGEMAVIKSIANVRVLACHSLKLGQSSALLIMTGFVGVCSLQFHGCLASTSFWRALTRRSEYEAEHCAINVISIA